MYRLLLVLLLAGPVLVAQPLPRSTPEKEGVSSAAISDFLVAMSKSKNELHGFVFIRHGKVIADAWAKPYADSLKHTLYSTSKSFTSTAVGFAVAENKLKVTDKVVSFFPELVPDTASQYLRDLTVKDLLTMSVGHATDPSATIPGTQEWVRTFLQTPIANKPGTKFLYNSMATFMLSAIVQKVTGEKIVDYLEPRLFQPLGIKSKDWETNPEGYNVGGWGLRLRTADIAKLGLLYLNKGKWNGKQILPESWIAEASTAQIRQNPDATQAQLATSDWLQGYGYQFWRSRNNSYRADGAFGQYILIMPDVDAVIAINSETPDMQDIMNLVFKHLLPAMKSSAIADNAASVANLRKVSSSLAIRPFVSAADTIGAVVAGTKPVQTKTINFDSNDRGFESISFNETKDRLTVVLNTAAGNHELVFGQKDWVLGSTNLKPPSLTARAINGLEGLAPFYIAGRYRWKSPTVLELQLQYRESTHHATWTCYFANGSLKLEQRSSFTNFREDKIDQTFTGK